MDKKYLRPIIALAAAVTLLVAGCSSNNADEPPISGDTPTETALSMTSPDAETQPSEEPSDAETTPKQPTTDESPMSSAETDNSADGDVDAEAGPNSELRKAAETAFAEISDGVPSGIESENNDTQWEVKIIGPDGTKNEVIVSRDGETIVSGPREKNTSEQDQQKYLDQVQSAKLTYLDAVEALEGHIPDGVIDELELDTEDGRLVWEADVYGPDGSKNELLVDAETGAVTIDD